MDVIVDNKYKMIKKIGSGAFGDIYRGKQKKGFNVFIKTYTISQFNFCYRDSVKQGDWR